MNDDKYIPPYADDPRLKNLRTQVEIIYQCGKASAKPDDAEALSSVLASHPNATSLFTVDELSRSIQNYRIRRTDFFADQEIDRALFALDQDIQNRIAELSFEELYRPLINASPTKIAGLTRIDFLAALFPQGTSALMLDSSRAREGFPWNIEIAEDIGGAWFWPLPVLVEGEEDDLIEKAKASVAAWKSATGNFGSDSLELMRDQIISREIPVGVVMSTNAGNTIIFAIDAHDEKEWRTKCRELRAKIKALGAECPPFRYDWVSPMIHMPYTRLVYFCP